MAQVTYVAVATASRGVSSGTATATVSVPTGTANGDLMIAHVQTSTASSTVSTPTGWTLQDSDTTSGNGATYLFYRFASSEPASYDFVGSGTGGAISICAGIVTLRNTHASSPFDQQSKNVDTTSDTTANGTAVTPTTSPQSILLAFTSSVLNNTYSAQAVANNNPTWTETYDFSVGSAGSYSSLNMVYGTYDFITTTGAFTATLSSATKSTTFLVSIRPAGFSFSEGFTSTGTQSGTVSSAMTPANGSIFAGTGTMDGTASTASSKWSNTSKNTGSWVNETKT